MKPLLIVGAGLAGYTLAREFRKCDASRPIILVTADSGNFYSKPTLSNACALDQEAEQLVTSTAAQMAEQLNLTLLAGARVTGLNTAAKTIATSFGEFSYGQLVLATGAQAGRPPLAGEGAEAVLSVNHLDDYARLRHHLAAAGPGARVLILGGGLAGCEFADDLCGAGHAVTVVDPQSRLLANLAPPALSEGLRRALSARGVSFALGTAALAVERDGQAWRVRLSNGNTVGADVTLAAVGLRPDLRLAQAAGLATGRGILVDGTGRTSAPDVYALGDCAEYNDAGSHSLLPYVAPMMVAARALARSLSGEPTAIQFRATPILVKTPSFPIALLPPPEVQGGEWRTTEYGQRLICRYYDSRGLMRGFGVAPQEASVRQGLLAELGSTSLVAA